MPVNSFENYPMSWKPKRERLDQPLYLSLAAQLEKDIGGGVLLPGVKLPPQRELADYLDVNLSTISRAFRICAQKGLINGSVGNGTFVTYDAISNLYLKLQPETKHQIEIGTILNEPNNNDELVETLKKMITEQDFGRLFECGNTEGILWHREAAARLIMQANCNTSTEEILFANGGQNAIAIILSGLFKQGDRIGADPYTYSGFKTVAKMIGIQLVAIHHKNKEMCEEALFDACRKEKIKGLFIMPDYQNPTTHIMSQETRKMIARVAKENDLIIIEDATHSLLQVKPPKPVKTYAPDNTVYMMSLSKVIAPGLRIAYIASPEKYRPGLFKALYNINLFTPRILLEIASRMVITKDVDELIKKNRSIAKQRNELVNKYFSEHITAGSDECIFRWLSLPNGTSGAQFEDMAMRNGVLVYASEHFAVGNEKPIPAVRMAITAPDSMNELESALKILKELLTKLLIDTFA